MINNSSIPGVLKLTCTRFSGIYMRRGRPSATKGKGVTRNKQRRTFHNRSLQSRDPDRKKRSSLGWNAIEVTKSRC